jgi:hypothetical protein
MSNIIRLVGAGRTFLSPTDLFVEANTNDGGQVEIVLPNTKLIFGNTNTNTAYNYVGVRFIDLGNNASVNNIVIYAFDDDLINGQQTLTINTNGGGGLINLIGEGQWIFDENNSSTSNPIIQQGSGLNSSQRINSGNTSSGAYSTALGKSNCVDSIGSFVNGTCNSASGYISNDIVGGCCNTSGTPNFIFPNNCVTQSGLYFNYCFIFPNNCVTQSGLYFNSFSAYGNVIDIANDGSSITLQGDLSSCSSYLPATANGIYSVYNNGTCSTYANAGISGSSLSCIDYDGVNTKFCYNPPIPLPFYAQNSFGAYGNVIDIANDGSSITLQGDFSSCSAYLPATANGIYAVYDNGTCSTYATQGICGNSLSCINYDGVNTQFCYNPSIPLPFLVKGNSYSSVINGCCNIASGEKSSVINGICNTASGYMSSITNGTCNTASCSKSFIGNGNCNTTSGVYSSVINGRVNTASGYISSIINGLQNNASGCRSSIINGYANTTSAYQSIIGSGYGNIVSGSRSTIINGVYNTASAVYTHIGNGLYNCVSENYSSVSNGYRNTISSRVSTILNGFRNTASGYISSVINGCCNIASCNHSSIINGCCNIASNVHSTIINGRCNTSSFYHSIILNGFCNTASNNKSSVINGVNNTASGYASSVINGRCNIASCIASSVINGCKNTASAKYSLANGSNNIASGGYSTIINGDNNTASGYRSFIAGGYNNNTCGFTDAFILGSGISASIGGATFVNQLYINNLKCAVSQVQSGGLYYEPTTCIVYWKP